MIKIKSNEDNTKTTKIAYTNNKLNEVNNNPYNKYGWYDDHEGNTHFKDSQAFKTWVDMLANGEIDY